MAAPSVPSPAFATDRGAAPGFRAAEQAVDAFWRHHRRFGRPLHPAVDYLAGLALSSDPPSRAAGTRALFAQLIEPLCDAFDGRCCAAYREVFARVIAAARRSADCRRLDETLRARGLDVEAVPPCAARARPGSDGFPVRGIVVLSRLTLGADVAVVTPILRRVRSHFPEAAVFLAGGEGAKALARCLPGVRHCPIAYGRADSLAARLNAWPELCAAIDGCTDGLPAAECIVVDPDSRLTQLGLLPPVEYRRYFHFPSRDYGGEGGEALSALVQRWLDELFGAAADTPPTLDLTPGDAAWAKALRETCSRPARPIAAVSFGVGGNDAKRVGMGFEAGLAAWLVGRGWRVLLARGAGAAETERSYRLCRLLAERGLTISHLPAGRCLEGIGRPAPDIVTWEADTGAFMAAIAAADVYIGYDSAGHHLAPALGTPTLSLFVESSGPRHGRRWTPRGRAPVRVVRYGDAPDERLALRAAHAGFVSLCREAGIAS